MKIADLDFPDPILSALRDDSLVVFAGAGVSMGKPAFLPSFTKLTMKIAEGTGQNIEGEEPEDRFLGKLQHQDVDVHKRAADIFSGKNLAPTDLHKNLLRLYGEVGKIRIVTTNFDLLFEKATNIVFENEPEVFKAPALPLGRNFSGIVHIHGAVSDYQRMILTDADFGRAYLTDGWARRFLVDLFGHFLVLFVGYSHNDIILNYLACALPVNQSKGRFALTKTKKDTQKERQRWEVLGIKPVFYPKSSADGHRTLYQGIKKLADFIRLGVLDWKRIITDIAQAGPSLDEEEMGLVREALSDPNKVHFFTDAASSPKWIDWLDKKKYLDGLFETRDLNEIDRSLSKWLVTKFAFSHADDLFLLFGRHETRICPDFWAELGRTVGLDQSNSPLDKPAFARWVSFLLFTASLPMPRQLVSTVLTWLGERCIERGMSDKTLEIFDSMAKIHIQIGPSLIWSDGGADNQPPRINVELPLVRDHFSIEKLWKEGLKPNLVQLAEPLLERLIYHLETQHFTFSTWQQANRIFNPTSRGRAGIEPHEQDRHPEAVDVLIDAARDCLGWLAQCQETVSAFWSDRLAASEAPILRRLSVYTVSVRKGLSAEDKMEWLLKDGRLHDLSARHEIFHLAEQVYPKAGLELRKAFLAAVQEYRWPDEEDTKREMRTACHHLNWFHWLHSAVPSCAMTKQALKDLQAEFSNLTPSEHPDFTPWTEDRGFVQPQSPWSVEDLLEKSAAEWLPELLSFQPCEVIGPDRSGPMSAIEDAAKWNLTWGLELADSLANDKKWDVDLWEALLRAWASMELDEARHREILSRLQAAELYPKHHFAIARMLRDWMTDGGNPYFYHLLATTNKIATTLWHTFDGNDLETGLSSDWDWLDRAINHSAGVLTEYWIRALVLARNKDEPTPKVLVGEFLRAFSAIVNNDALAGRLGRSVLASQFAFMLRVDEQWTIENLIPFFSSPEEDDFRAVWDGFLTGRRITPKVAGLLYEPSLQAVERFSKAPSNQSLVRFVDYYTIMLSYFAKNHTDLIKEWIPALLNNDNDLIRERFAWKIWSLLHDLNDVQQHEWWNRWLKRYWKNRLEGVPAPLKTSEITGMLEWLPYLTAVFTEAVDLAIQMPLVPLKRGLVMRELKGRKVIEDHPGTVGKLLVHLGKVDSSDHVWHAGKKLVYALLQKKELPSEIIHQLKELAAKQKWNDTLDTT